jgi:uncharacterized membrane protein YkoI
MKRLPILAAMAVSLALASQAGAASYKGEELSKDAKITIEQAQAIASKARKGEITDKELEKEKGGSGLRYSFDIKSDGKTYEVGVDANTGKVLENKPEGKYPN